MRPSHRWELENRWLDAEQLVETLAYNNTPSTLNDWQGQNFSGWCQEEANLAIVRANTTVSLDERIANYTQHEAIYINEVPELPLFNPASDCGKSFVCVWFDDWDGQSVELEYRPRGILTRWETGSS